MRQRAKAVLEVLGRWISPDEVELVLALCLIAAGFWMFWKPGSCLIPGAVLLWHVLPSRAPFFGDSATKRED